MISDKEQELINEINSACLKAYYQCPQHIRLDAELIGDTLEEVLDYWNDEHSLGGSILWNSGYCEDLDEEVSKIFDRLNDDIVKAPKRLADLLMKE